MNANQNFSVSPVALVRSMIQNIPQFKDVRTQQDAEECISGFYNIFQETNIKYGLRELFEFEMGIQITPLDMVDGAVSEVISEKS